VNVAARLQAECPPCGLCVSRAVRDHVHDRLDLIFEELGVRNLKNIGHPVEVFVLRLVPIETTPQFCESSLLQNAPDFWRASKAGHTGDWVDAGGAGW
jgi:hypothetical protein